MRKNEKMIALKLYQIGMAKDTVYKTMKENKLDVKRDVIRKYLKYPKVRGSYKNSNYLKKISVIKQSHKVNPNIDIKDSIKRTNKQFLQWAMIVLLKDKKIKNQKSYGHLVRYDPYTHDWGSP
ncbi:MAG: hypothetical protein QXV17_07315 [Candidatus Micrarchaeaceae archaeon]